MNHCKHCRFWAKPDRGQDYVIRPVNPAKSYEGYDSEDEELTAGFNKVNRCASPNVLFYKRPLREQAAIFDGSDYQATLYTGEDFGCTLFENVDD